MKKFKLLEKKVDDFEPSTGMFPPSSMQNKVNQALKSKVHQHLASASPSPQKTGEISPDQTKDIILEDEPPSKKSDFKKELSCEEGDQCGSSPEASCKKHTIQFHKARDFKETAFGQEELTRKAKSDLIDQKITEFEANFENIEGYM